jgi:D-amino peptidase
MKIMIMTDMECVSGVTFHEYLDRNGPFFEATRRSFTGDVNAAAEGCFAAGADEVFIRLGHGPESLVPDMLDQRVQIAGESPGNWTGLDESFTATLMIGQHAKAGTINAFLEHTQSAGTIYDHSINGTSLGETGQWALMAGHFGVPLIFLAGDDAACREAEELIPGVRTVSVGSASGRQTMLPRNQQGVWREITATTEEALSAMATKPFRMAGPYKVRITVMRSDQADQLCRLRSDRQRIDGRTIEMTVNSPLEILNIFV